MKKDNEWESMLIPEPVTKDPYLRLPGSSPCLAYRVKFLGG